LRDKLLALAALQKVDLDIAALKKNAEAYPREMAELEKQLNAAKAAVDAERTKLEQLEIQKRTLEQNVSEDKDKVRKWEGRLSEQRSTREYSALAREIDIAKKGQVTMTEEGQELGRQALVQREMVKAKEADFTARTKNLVDRIDALKAMNTLRVCTVAGAPITAEIIEKFESASGAALLNIYGSTEAGAISREKISTARLS